MNPPTLIEGRYLTDLLAQPEVLHRVRRKLSGTAFETTFSSGLRTGRYRRMVLTGMGSSLHALYPLHRALSAAGTRLMLEAGAESTVSCKTYVATLAVLHWSGAQLIRGEAGAALEELAQAEEAVREYLAKWREHMEELRPLLDGVTSVFVTGRGDSLATAGTGGLILKEPTRQHAEGMSSAAFRLGPLEMAGRNVLVLIFEDDESISPLHRRLAEDITRGGSKAVLIGSETTGLEAFRLPAVPAGVWPIVEILPVQMLSLALEARDGFEAGRFERASKITNIA